MKQKINPERQAKAIGKIMNTIVQNEPQPVEKQVNHERNHLQNIFQSFSSNILLLSIAYKLVNKDR